MDQDEASNMVEQRGGKSKHFEADLYELLPSDDCIASTIIKNKL